MKIVLLLIIACLFILLANRAHMFFVSCLYVFLFVLKVMEAGVEAGLT